MAELREKVRLPINKNGRPIICFIAKNLGDIDYLRKNDKDMVMVSNKCYALCYHGADYEVKNGLAEVYADSYFFAIDAILTLLDEENMNKYEHFMPVQTEDESYDWQYKD